MSFIDQGQIIDKINEEFTRSNMPIDLRFDESGVCRGLSTVYGKFFLEDREKDFIEMLELIASGNTSNEKISEGDVYVFAAEILMASQPAVYEPRFNQSTSMKLLKINGKQLDSSFDLVLSTTDENWATIFKTLDFEPDEVVLLGGNRHSVAVRKEEGVYKVYDPNYSNGFKDFLTDKALIRELHFNVFDYNEGNFGLKLNVLRHPEKNRSKEFPKIKHLYQQYYDPMNSKLSVLEFNSESFYSTFFPLANYVDKYIGTRFSAWYFSEMQYDYLQNAMKFIRDEEAIDCLLNREKLTPEQLFDLATSSIYFNNEIALKVMLPKMENDKKKIECLIHSALYNGCIACFDVLEPYFKKNNESEKISHLIYMAAHGANPELLKKILDRNSENKSDLNSVSILYFGVLEAIKSGSFECVEMMINEMEKLDAPLNLTPHDYLLFLQEAIKENKVSVVIGLINRYPHIPKDTLHYLMSPLMATRTNLEVLEVLKDKGFELSISVLDVMQQKKEGKRLNLKTQLDIFVNCLSNFLHAITNIAITKVREFKNKVADFKKPLPESPAIWSP